MKTKRMMVYGDIQGIEKLGNTSITYIANLQLTHIMLDWVYVLMASVAMCKLQHPHICVGQYVQVLLGLS